MQIPKVNQQDLITPRELVTWVPGRIVCDSDDCGWKDISQRTYAYDGQDVEIPPMDSFMIVQYRIGETPMDRQFDGRWTRTVCRPGHFSLLSRSAESHWNWTAPVEVSHLYLTNTLMARVASELQEKNVFEIELQDVLCGSDDLMTHISNEITRETTSCAIGGALYVESLSVQLAVLLLRKYTTRLHFNTSTAAKLSHKQIATLEAYINDRLDETLSLEGMAQLFGLGSWTFNRHLRAARGTSAYAFVLEKRIERAAALLRHQGMALKEIAAACGFSDQAHMTRTFRAKFGVTPGAYRNRV